MKRPTLAAIFTIALLVSTVVAGGIPAAAGPGTPVVDQEFTSPDNLDALINGCCRFSAQTFTAGRSGSLSASTSTFEALGRRRCTLRSELSARGLQRQ